ncbi:MAG: DUF72 domain-containing protein [Planctomycetes bacterium]|nr:DUF72 domain-containing protein [Planctomycetota bacterium]
MADGLLFGVAGWSYDDWKGVVYPRGCKDTLRAVAERVDLTEINSTFYGLPSAKNGASWVRRTEDLGTRFTAKLPQQFTHARQFDDALIAEVRDGFAPLSESGRLVGLLAQYNHELQYDRGAIEQIARLAEGFAPTAPLFVELRHRSWNASAGLDALASLGVGVLELDYPGMVGGFSRDVTGVRADGVAYFRLHGRNRAWFRRGASRDEVYDWRYSDDEVRQLRGRVDRIARDATRAIVVANNHFHGKAMAVIEELMAYYRDGAAPREQPRD